MVLLDFWGEIESCPGKFATSANQSSALKLLVMGMMADEDDAAESVRGRLGMLLPECIIRSTLDT